MDARCERRLGRRLLFGAAVAALLAAPLRASAQAQQGGMPAFPAPDEAETGTVRAPPPDQRTGHFYLDALVGAVGPAGHYAPGVSTSSLTSVGLTVGGILGVGVGRSSVIEARGNYTLYAGPGRCTTGCSGRGFDLSVGLSHHIAQGIAFDPWVGFGVGLRFATFTVPAAEGGGLVSDQSYRGFDFTRISLGGDFYPLPFLGFGPFLQADVGYNFARPKTLEPLDPNLSTGIPVYAFFQVGVRIAFDPLRTKLSRRPAPKKEPAQSAWAAPHFAAAAPVSAGW